MKKHIKYSDFNYSIKKLEKLNKNQLSKVDGGSIKEGLPIIEGFPNIGSIIISPPGCIMYIPPEF